MNDPNVHICIFRKRCGLTLGCFFPVTILNTLSTNPAKWSNTPKLPANCLSMFDHFVGLALKRLKYLLAISFLHLVFSMTCQWCFEALCVSFQKVKICYLKTSRISIKAGFSLVRENLDNLEKALIFEKVRENLEKATREFYKIL